MSGMRRGELDAAVCQHEGCPGDCSDVLVFSGRCHRGAPTIAVYDPTIGCLLLLCSRCNSEVAAIEVATSPAPTRPQ